MADPTTQLSFAHLPFELRDSIWRSAAEDELPGVHNLTLYNLASDNALQHTRDGAIRFEPRGAKDQNTEGQGTDNKITTGYAMKPWAVKDGKPDYQGLTNVFQGLGSVCPEAFRVVRKINDTMLIQGVYKANDGQTRKISIRTEKDLIYLNLFSAADISWPQVRRSIPLFQPRLEIEHVAFQFDPAWCRYAVVSPRSDNPGIIDVVTRQPCHGRDANILRSITFSLQQHWIEHVWLIDLELRRTKSFRKRHHGKGLVEVDKDRFVFYGNGYRLVEVQEGDVGWDFAYKARNRRSRGNCPPAVAQRNAFDLVNQIFDDSYSLYRITALGVYIAAAYRLHWWRLPNLGILACEKMP
jgi:hypothetical protein